MSEDISPGNLDAMVRRRAATIHGISLSDRLEYASFSANDCWLYAGALSKGSNDDALRAFVHFPNRSFKGKGGTLLVLPWRLSTT